MIHRNRRAARPHQRGHHRAEGAETVAAGAEAARAGEAEQLSKMGAPGVAGRRPFGRRRGSVATSGRPQQRGLVERGEAKGHPDHRGEPGSSPRSLVEKSQRDGIVGTLGVRLARCEMKSIPSLLMAPHVLIAMMTRRMLGAMSPY